MEKDIKEELYPTTLEYKSSLKLPYNQMATLTFNLVISSPRADRQEIRKKLIEMYSKVLEYY